MHYRGHVLACACLGMLTGALAQTSPFPIHNGAKILFIGNSLTNNGGGLDTWVMAIGAADHPAVSITATKSIMFATELSGIYNNGAARTEIANGHYDIVVLQGWEDAILNHDSLYKYVRLFDVDIKAAGAKTVLFMTWPEIEHGEWAPIVLRDAYDSAGAMVNAPVVHVGSVWWGARRRPPAGFGLDTAFLYADAIHPNDTGGFVDGMCFYTFFTRKSPVGLRVSVDGLNLCPALQDSLEGRVWLSIGADVRACVAVREQPISQRSGNALSVGDVQNVTVAGARIFGINGALLPARSAQRPAPGFFVVQSTGRPERVLRLEP